MIISDLNIFCACFRPPKADAPLIVDTNAILADPVTFEGLKAIAGRYPQIIQPSGNIELPQLSAGNRFDVHEPPHAHTF
jgi:hypothetical protein